MKWYNLSGAEAWTGTCAAQASKALLSYVPNETVEWYFDFILTLERPTIYPHRGSRSLWRSGQAN